MENYVHTSCSDYIFVESGSGAWPRSDNTSYWSNNNVQYNYYSEGIYVLWHRCADCEGQEIFHTFHSWKQRPCRSSDDIFVDGGSGAWPSTGNPTTSGTSNTPSSYAGSSVCSLKPASKQTATLAKMVLLALAFFPLLLSNPTMAAIRNRMPELCVTTTGDPCVFPFTYKVSSFMYPEGTKRMFLVPGSPTTTL